jgi:Holliday junction resolvase YEN1
LRTLFHRLVRLLSLSIQPIFVFDGPEKPPFKRGRSTSTYSSQHYQSPSRSLIELFGFPCHHAPGEAEADCALLQREGIVDAVLSEDVDTLMFGCGLTLRKWSSENPRGKVPTHVSIYDAKKDYNGLSGLTREGMILVALISGGDYIPQGIPKSGIKLACEAARAGYGESLCALHPDDESGLETWKTDLVREVQTNESRYFKFKRKNFTIPSEFPSRTVLGYYTHPLVSSAGTIESLKSQKIWNKEIDIGGLREYVAKSFGWKGRAGAKKLIRNLAPALLISKLCERSQTNDSGLSTPTDLEQIELEEGAILRGICGDRKNINLDGMAEIRVIYVPTGAASFNCHVEVSDDSNEDEHESSEDDIRNKEIEAVEIDRQPRQARKRAAVQYDPEKPEKVWIPATLIKLGTPLMWQDWEEMSHNSKNKATLKEAGGRARSKGGMKQGALDRYMVATKPGVRHTDQRNKQLPNNSEELSQDPFCGKLAPITSTPSKIADDFRTPGSVLRSPGKGKQRQGSRKETSNQAVDRTVNPWTISQTSNKTGRLSSLSSGRDGSSRHQMIQHDAKSTALAGESAMDPVLISSSPPENYMQRNSPLMGASGHQSNSNMDCAQEGRLQSPSLPQTLEPHSNRFPQTTQAPPQSSRVERSTLNPKVLADGSSEATKLSNTRPSRSQQSALLGPVSKSSIHRRTSCGTAHLFTPLSTGNPIDLKQSCSPDLLSTTELLSQVESPATLCTTRLSLRSRSQHPYSTGLVEEVSRANTANGRSGRSVHHSTLSEQSKTQDSRGNIEIIDLT